MNKFKKNIIKVIINYLLIIILITIFSKTIFNINLPVVSTVFIKEGAIIKKTEGTGLISFIKTENIYSEIDGEIVFIKNINDYVKKGEKILVIKRDINDINKNSKLLDYEYDKIILQIEKINTDILYEYDLINKINLELKNMKTKTEVKTNTYSEIANYNEEMLLINNQIKNLEISIENKNNEIEKSKILFDSGVISEKEYKEQILILEQLEIDLENTINSKKLKEENYKLNNNEKEVQANKKYEDDLKDLEILKLGLKEEIKEHEKIILDLNNSLKTYEVDKNHYLEKIANNKYLEENTLVEIYSECNGIVVDREKNINKKDINKNSYIMEIGDLDTGFKTIINLPKETDFVFVNQEVSLRILSLNNENIIGLINSIDYNDDNLVAEIYLNNNNNNLNNNLVELKINISTEIYKNILPNEAIHEDNGNNYIFYVERKNGAFGFEYYVKKKNILVIEQDDTHTAFNIDMEDKTAIIKSYNKEIKENDKIRLN